MSRICAFYREKKSTINNFEPRKECNGKHLENFPEATNLTVSLFRLTVAIASGWGLISIKTEKMYQKITYDLSSELRKGQ